MERGIMNAALVDLLNKRRDRTIAVILRVKDQECDHHLPMDSSLKLRKVVLDQINAFADLAVDVITSLEDNSDVVLNEYWLERLNEIHEAVTKT